jgi:hypothetical protein
VEALHHQHPPVEQFTINALVDTSAVATVATVGRRRWFRALQAPRFGLHSSLNSLAAQMFLITQY